MALPHTVDKGRGASDPLFKSNLAAAREVLLAGIALPARMGIFVSRHGITTVGELWHFLGNTTEFLTRGEKNLDRRSVKRSRAVLRNFIATYTYRPPKMAYQPPTSVVACPAVACPAVGCYVDPERIDSGISLEDVKKALVAPVLSSEVQEALTRIPLLEQKAIEFYFRSHVHQAEIAHTFGVSQPTVSYRLQKGIQRIRYLLTVPKLNPDVLRRDLGKLLVNSCDVDLMVFMYETTCQSESAKRLGVSQGLVRHRFMRIMRQLLESRDPTMAFYGKTFELVSKNLNALRELPRPKGRVGG